MHEHVYILLSFPSSMTHHRIAKSHHIEANVNAQHFMKVHLQRQGQMHVNIFKILNED